jgi:hypothetical protein
MPDGATANGWTSGLVEILASLFAQWHRLTARR